jgi:hypothetical protein
MFDKLKGWFGPKANINPEPIVPKPEPPPAPPKPKPAKAPEKSAKELATERGEPYVAVLSMDVDPENLHQGAFELDWNEKFVANLLRAGYQGKTDSDIVDQWFQNVCRHVVMETWEQEQAIKNSGIYVQSRNIGDGRSEVS